MQHVQRFHAPRRPAKVYWSAWRTVALPAGKTPPMHWSVILYTRSNDMSERHFFMQLRVSVDARVDEVYMEDLV